MSIVRFYTDAKDGVAFNPKVRPFLTKQQSLKYRGFSNFYRAPEFSFWFDGREWMDSETPFQYYRWLDAAPPATDPSAEDYLRFAEEIRVAPTPSKAFFLNRFVSYRKKDGVAYCNAPFPQFREYADAVMAAYHKGVRRPTMDGARDIRLMYDILQCKFDQNPPLMALLKSTGSADIAEHTTRDRMWGDGGDGSGSNWLGKLLVAVRDRK